MALLEWTGRGAKYIPGSLRSCRYTYQRIDVQHTTDVQQLACTRANPVTKPRPREQSRVRSFT
eukprot:5815490-Pleurochrysis_carterae.AAC.1